VYICTILLNKLLNSHQSAHCKYCSVETALLIHDHLINAAGSHKYHASALLTSVLPLTLLSWL